MRRRSAIVAGATACAVVAFTVSLGDQREEPREATIRGFVEAGSAFSQAFGRGLTFCLDPIQSGWIISVRKEGCRDDLTRLTPPFHLTNARDIEGWHFRNADNTGPNERGPLNVNAPQELRDFIFSPHVTRDTPLTHEEVERTRAFGIGELEILDHELSPATKGERARMLAMEFEVRLRWR